MSSVGNYSFTMVRVGESRYDFGLKITFPVEIVPEKIAEYESRRDAARATINGIADLAWQQIIREIDGLTDTLMENVLEFAE